MPKNSLGSASFIASSDSQGNRSKADRIGPCSLAPGFGLGSCSGNSSVSGPSLNGVARGYRVINRIDPYQRSHDRLGSTPQRQGKWTLRSFRRRDLLDIWRFFRGREELGSNHHRCWRALVHLDRCPGAGAQERQLRKTSEGC